MIEVYFERLQNVRCILPESTMIWTGSGGTSRQCAGAGEAGVAVGLVELLLHNLGDSRESD